jgi:hypothetical protein
MHPPRSSMNTALWTVPVLRASSSASPEVQERRDPKTPRSDIVTQSGNAANIMKRGSSRSIFRWIHLVFSIPILGYIYSPFEKLPNYAPATRSVFVPVIVLSGLWKGHVVRRLISKRSGRWYRCVLEPVIFDRRMTRQYQERCDVVDVIGVAGRRVAGEAERS